MKKKFKFALIIIVVFALLAIAALYFLKRKKQVGPDCNQTDAQTCPVDLSSLASPDTTQTTVGSFASPTAVALSKYTSAALDFELTFSDAWKDVKVLETIPNTAHPGKVEFQFSTKDPSFKGSATALTIYVYKKDQVPSLQEQPMLTKIAESNELYYGYTAWRQAPSDLGAITEKEIARQAATLKLLN